MEHRNYYGTKVRWQERKVWHEGVVCEIYTVPVMCSINGNPVQKHGSRGNPALLIKSHKGKKALKCLHETSIPTEVLASA